MAETYKYGTYKVADTFKIGERSTRVYGGSVYEVDTETVNKEYQYVLCSGDTPATAYQRAEARIRKWNKEKLGDTIDLGSPGKYTMPDGLTYIGDDAAPVGETKLLADAPPQPSGTSGTSGTAGSAGTSGTSGTSGDSNIVKSGWEKLGITKEKYESAKMLVFGAYNNILPFDVPSLIEGAFSAKKLASGNVDLVKGEVLNAVDSIHNFKDLSDSQKATYGAVFGVEPKQIERMVNISDKMTFRSIIENGDTKTLQDALLTQINIGQTQPEALDPDMKAAILLMSGIDDPPEPQPTTEFVPDRATGRLIEKVTPPDPIVYKEWQKTIEENKKKRNDYVQLTLQRSQNIQKYVKMNVGQITTDLFAGSGSAKDFGKAFETMDPGLKSLFTDTLGVPESVMKEGASVASIYRSMKDIKSVADFDALDPEFKEALAKKTGVSVGTMRSMVNVSSKIEDTLKSKKSEIAAAGGVGGLMSWAEEAKKKAEAAAYELTKQLLQEEVLDKFAPGQNINDLAQWPPVVNWREIHRVDPRVKATIAETVGFGSGSAAVAELEAMIGQAQRYAELVERGLELKDRLTEHTGKLEDAIKNNDVNFVQSYASDLGVAASTLETLINTSYALGSASYAWDFSTEWEEDPIWGVDIPDGEWYSRYPERAAIEGGVIDSPDLNDQTPDPPSGNGRGPYLDKYVLLEAFGLNMASVSENADGSINYAGDVRIDLDRAQQDIGYGSPIFDRLPPMIKFGEITGNFGILGENLNSLEGFPYLVTGRISISTSKALRTLETLPEIKACGGFFANGLKELRTLKGAPRIINGTFDVSDTGIVSLEGGPNTVNGNYVCSDCPNLSSIFGAPTTLKGQFISQDNDAITKAMVDNYKRTNNLKWLGGELLGKSVTEQERVRYVQATAAANAAVDGNTSSGDQRAVDEVTNTAVITGQTFATTGPGWLQPGNMMVSDNGLAYLERKEGIRYQVYDDARAGNNIISSYSEAKGTPTIGIGHAIWAESRGKFEQYLGGRNKMTKDQVYALKRQDIPKYARPMNTKITSPITQNMFDAMLSLSFNAGVGGKALKKAMEFINQKRYLDAASAIKNGPQTGKGIGFIPSLQKRRKEEAELFLLGMPGAPPNAANTITGTSPVGSAGAPQKINTIQVGGAAPLNTPSPYSPMGSRVVQQGSYGQFKSSMNNKNAQLIFVVGGLDVGGRKCGAYMWDYFTDGMTGKYHVYVKSTHESSSATNALAEAWSIMKQHGLQSYKSVCYFFSAGNKAALPVLKATPPSKWHAIFLVGPCLVGSQSYVNGMVPLIQSAAGRFNFSSVGGTKEGGDANYQGQDAFQLKLQLMQPIPASNQLVGTNHMKQNSAVVSRLVSVVGT